jgi:hypothetical protein
VRLPPILIKRRSNQILTQKEESTYAYGASASIVSDPSITGKKGVPVGRFTIYCLFSATFP